MADAVANGVKNEIGSASYGTMTENPRWLFYARTTDPNVHPNRYQIDCHNRAALAASALGIVGIKSYVHMAYGTAYPVPSAPQGWPQNSTTNDYVGTYSPSSGRMKYANMDGYIKRLMIDLNNNFEGNLRVEDGSADDGNVWWTIWPFQKYNNAKELLKSYSNNGQCWGYTNGCDPSEPIPNQYLDNKPKVIGGPS